MSHTTAAAAIPVRPFLLGAWADALLVGGGLSLVVTAALILIPTLQTTLNSLLIAMTILFNFAHFAGSTVRLYTKADTRDSHALLSSWLPLAMFLIVLGAVIWPGKIGFHLNALYLTWSPFHYAAQTFGLCFLYANLSKMFLSSGERRQIKAAALLPFAFALLEGRRYGAGIGWVFPRGTLESMPSLETAIQWTQMGLAGLAFLAPIVWIVRRRLWHGRQGWMIPLLLASNAVWWILALKFNVFVWITTFHALQYLVVLVVFQRSPAGSATHGGRLAFLRAPIGFYLAIVAVGFALFRIWPYALTGLGFGYAEATLSIVAAINVHHFIVDAYIWKFRRGDSNQDVLKALAAA